MYNASRLKWLLVSIPKTTVSIKLNPFLKIPKKQVKKPKKMTWEVKEPLRLYHHPHPLLIPTLGLLRPNNLNPWDTARFKGNNNNRPPVGVILGEVGASRGPAVTLLIPIVNRCNPTTTLIRPLTEEPNNNSPNRSNLKLTRLPTPTFGRFELLHCNSSYKELERITNFWPLRCDSLYRKVSI